MDSALHLHINFTFFTFSYCSLFQVSNFLQRVRSSQTAMSRKKKRKNYVTSSVVVETDYISVEELELVS